MRSCLGILEEMSSGRAWRSFFEYKLEKAHLSETDAQFLNTFIETGSYISLAEKMPDENFCFSYPQKVLINKIGTTKKRVVYRFPEDECMMLKLMAFLLYRYDGEQTSNCYSFRNGFGAKSAIRHITSACGIADMYCCKLDIKNYFNSINIDKLLPILKETLSDDIALYDFLSRLLTADKAYYQEELITEKRGVMAGTPISPFLANLYLREMDRHFEALGVLYARYSDDVILFAPTMDDIDRHMAYIHELLSCYDLEINKDKEAVLGPHCSWDFLGIGYSEGKIDLSDATKQKIKGKIRRKARSIYRWKLKKNASDDKAMRVFTRVFNRKFFENTDANELTWSRWFFPLVTVDAGLKEIDAYMQQYLRFIATGKHSRSNYRIDYAFLKKCGYLSLVNAYYKFRNTDPGILVSENK
jgi:RNA-directed DNA polymerase